MSGYAGELLRLTAAHVLALVSPGPDFALVLRHSLAHGRRAGICAAFGVATGLTVHVGYSLFGITLLIRHAPLVFQVIRWAGVAYLAWLGFQSLRLSFRAATPASGPAARGGRLTARHFFRSGLLTNLLNPKVTLFFAAIFATLISPATPGLIRVGYGIWVCAMTVAWFSLVATLFTHEPVRRRFLRLGPWIDRTLGVVFVGFAALLAAANVK